MSKEKAVHEMLNVANKDISDKDTLDALDLDNSGKAIKINTIVNAADPTLMGSDKPNTVDYKIHEAIDNILKQSDPPTTFNEKICEELAERAGAHTVGKPEEKKIRCSRGNAVLTKGYGLCTYVIHVVGAIYDGNAFKGKECSNSRVRTLESCYYKIVEVIRSHPDIKNVAIPIISSGNYGFPFEFAARIAVATIGNALLDWQAEDEESFESAAIENIVFFTGKPKQDSDSGRDKHEECVRKIIGEYRRVFEKQHRVVFQKTYQSQMQCIKEVQDYDEVRGYFSIARTFRLWLLRFRVVLGFLSNFIKDKRGGNDWQERRCVVERTALTKIFLPCILWGAVRYWSGMPEWMIILCTAALCYSTIDTVTYLMALLFLADIQRTSANVIRSMLLLLFNYIEVSLTMAYLYYLYGNGTVACRIALEFGIMGNIDANRILTLIEYLFLYGNAALKFFFLTIVFGYIAGHLRQRAFMTKEQ